MRGGGERISLFIQDNARNIKELFGDCFVRFVDLLPSRERSLTKSRINRFFPFHPSHSPTTTQYPHVMSRALQDTETRRYRGIGDKAGCRLGDRQRISEKDNVPRGCADVRSSLGGCKEAFALASSLCFRRPTKDAFVGLYMHAYVCKSWSCVTHVTFGPGSTDLHQIHPAVV